MGRWSSRCHPHLLAPAGERLCQARPHAHPPQARAGDALGLGNGAHTAGAYLLEFIEASGRDSRVHSTAAASAGFHLPRLSELRCAVYYSRSTSFQIAPKREGLPRGYVGDWRGVNAGQQLRDA